jgi:hypothetical protein
VDTFGTSTIQPRFGAECLLHPTGCYGLLFWPPYSADLAPSDFHICLAVKDYLSGHKFASDEDIKTFVMKWLKSQDTEFYEAEVNKLIP